jgi:molybdopterin molybdotransferase
VRPAGEDYCVGDIGLRRGTTLMPAQLGVLASFGLARVQVRRRPRAVLLTTGDELVAPGLPLAFGQIHDSNRYSLGALLESHGAKLLRHERVRDDPRILRDALLRAGADADIVVSSGGVSAGEADYLPDLIADVGRVHFWKVRIKPGMPFLFGEVGAAQVFALPGNPVSGIAIFLTLVRPALAAMSGATAPTAKLRARLTQAIDKRHARTEFQRAQLSCDDEGSLRFACFRNRVRHAAVLPKAMPWPCCPKASANSTRARQSTCCRCRVSSSRRRIICSWPHNPVQHPASWRLASSRLRPPKHANACVPVRC